MSIINIALFIVSPTTRAGGLLFNANALGSYLLFSLPLGIALTIDAKKWRNRMALLVGTALIALSFFLTFSYTGWVSFIIPLIILFVFYRRKLFTSKNALILIALIILFLMAMVGFRLMQTRDIKQAWRLHEVIPYEGVAFSFNQRLKFNLAALEMFRDYPITGIGLSSYQQIYPQYAKTVYEQPRYAHNYYVQTLAELGIFGFLALAWFILVLLRVIYNVIRRSLLDEQARKYVVGLGLGVLGSIIHVAFDFGWQFPAVFLLFWVAAGVMVGYSKNLAPNQTAAIPNSSRISTLMKVLIFFIGLVLLIRGFTLFLALSNFDRAEIAANDGDLKASLLYSKKGLSLNPDPDQYRTFGRNALLLAAVTHDYSDVELYTKRAIRWSKSDYFSYRLLGQIYFTQDLYDQAEEYYKKALDYDPLFHPLFHYDLASLYEKQERYDEATRLINDILTKYQGVTGTTNIYLNRDLSMLNELAGKIALKMGDKEKAALYFEESLRWDKDYKPAKDALDQLKLN